MVELSDIEIRCVSLDTSLRSREVIDKEISDVEAITSKHLSEPYSIYVYRFFINNWPDLCLLALNEGKVVGNIICKVEPHRNVRVRGYIGMLSVEDEFRGLGIAKKLIEESILLMINKYHCDEITLETEVMNKKALKLYENFGFIRIKRLFRYYMNRHDAYRLVLPITEKSSICSSQLPELENPVETVY
ncbi:N-alpha-acetyltransferase mak3 [Pichia californica]|uniref:N-alpha-acetyltransferase mak3 n=1 Tax=Pichia californica TaxID=460514 RepID=A0A9P6WJR1_9ASCO|nr:N-alpha-acetyltransferase mak3 [[Candida] californica]KAG0688425.1 N-alpha-acetyltransferase mak3 [[Candida] californica]